MFDLQELSEFDDALCAIDAFDADPKIAVSTARLIRKQARISREASEALVTKSRANRQERKAG
ncbi:MAG: hypothetical protein AAGA08_18575 [Pseudomonadota bacterium]